jgi:hypothetical protein
MLSDRIKTQISIIIDYKPASPGDKTFDDLLREELSTMSKIASLSKWLKIEYNSNKI